jgi:hypothetical protein
MVAGTICAAMASIGKRADGGKNGSEAAGAAKVGIT